MHGSSTLPSHHNHALKKKKILILLAVLDRSEWLISKLTSKYTSSSIIYFQKLCRIRTKQAFLPSRWPGQHSLLAMWVFFCPPPNLINKWVILILVKQLSANSQSKLTSFKQLQCPSCPEANFCQRKKNHHTHESGCCLSLDPVCSLLVLLAWTGEAGQFSQFLALKMRYKNQN